MRLSMQYMYIYMYMCNPKPKRALPGRGVLAGRQPGQLPGPGAATQGLGLEAGGPVREKGVAAVSRGPF